MAINFHYKPDKGWITTPGTEPVTMKMLAFYNIHKHTQTETMLLSFTKMRKKVAGNSDQTLQRESEGQIMRHPLKQIVDARDTQMATMMNTMNTNHASKEY